MFKAMIIGLLLSSSAAFCAAAPNTPDKFDFGGIFTIEYTGTGHSPVASGCPYPNPITGQCACPTGYSAARFNSQGGTPWWVSYFCYRVPAKAISHE